MSEWEDAVGQLVATKASARRTAAKKLRKLGEPAAEGSLISALERELEHPRTWEVQFEMINALGTCGGARAERVVRELAARELRYESLYTASGETSLRLSAQRGDPGEAVRWSVALANADLVDGALKGLAETGVALSSQDTEALLDFLEGQGPYEGVHYWAAVAAARWPGDRVRSYVAGLAAGLRADVAEAARTSLSARGE